MLYSCYFCRGVHLTLMKTVSNSKLSCTCKFNLDWEKSVGTWAVHVQFHSSFPGPFWAIQKPCAVQISDLRLGADPIFFSSLETGQGKQCIFDAWDIDRLDCALCLSICPWNPIDFFVCRGLHLTPVKTVSHNKYWAVRADSLREEMPWLCPVSFHMPMESHGFFCL